MNKISDIIDCYNEVVCRNFVEGDLGSIVKNSSELLFSDTKMSIAGFLVKLEKTFTTSNAGNVIEVKKADRNYVGIGFLNKSFEKVIYLTKEIDLNSMPLLLVVNSDNINSAPIKKLQQFWSLDIADRTPKMFEKLLNEALQIEDIYMAFYDLFTTKKFSTGLTLD